MDKNHHLVDCPTCKATVQGEECGIIWGNNKEGDFEQEAYVFIRCLVCSCPMVILTYYCNYGEGWVWDKKGRRVWPSIDEIKHPAIPNKVAKDLQDAKKCFDAGVYSAAVVMCGKALEGIVLEKCNEINLSKGLAKLKEMRVIDDRLYDWSELLRKERNLGAHSTDEEVTQDNALDLYDFVLALCEFIYILTEKYNTFVKRKGSITFNPKSLIPNP